jgi:fructose-1,6-bisphosphatase/inositol monophosphatase family enzyme
MTDVSVLLEPIRRIHNQIRDSLISEAELSSLAELSGIHHEDVSDTIYRIDTITEERLAYLFEALSRDHSFVLTAEGLSGKNLIYPRGAGEHDAEWRIIVDPIDGTRGLMYQKRSAWILTGVAPNRGPRTSLRDVVLAVQTEVPLVKQHLCDQLWAVRGKGAAAERYNRVSGATKPLRLQPSRVPTIAHGFAMISRFFPGGRTELAALDDEIVVGALGRALPGKAHCFEDQYISSGGQLYELMAGHDRFVADLRPLLQPLLSQQSVQRNLCCHPYDLCTSLIAEELGVIVTNPSGGALDAPLDVTSDVAWVGYANAAIRQQIEGLLQEGLRKRRWLQ